MGASLNTSVQPVQSELKQVQTACTVKNGQVDQSRLSFAGMARLMVGHRAPSVARIENMRNLVDYMRGRETTMDDVARKLKFTDTGARKYIAQLLEVGIVEIVRGTGDTSTKSAAILYRVTDSDERIEAGLTQIANKVSRATTKSAATVATRLGRDAAGNRRQFHILDDDEPFALHISRHVPQRDPLVAALFGAVVEPVLKAA